MDKLALRIDLCEDDWTAEWAIIASNSLDNISSPEFAWWKMSIPQISLAPQKFSKFSLFEVMKLLIDNIWI